jgi:hypothetical protein
VAELDLDVTALARLVENVRVDAPLAYGSLSRWMVARRELILDALERAERVEKAAREVDDTLCAGLDSADDDGIWDTPRWVAFMEASTNLRAALAPAPADEVVHMAPPGNKGVMPCCGRTPFELRATDRLTLDQARVTCRGAAPAEEGE